MNKLLSLNIVSGSSLLLILLLFFAACQDDKPRTNNGEDELVNTEDTINPQTKSTTETSLVYTEYNIPLPVELYRFMRNHDAKFNREILNPTTNLMKYNTSVVKAYNLGVYSSIVAYCTVFDQNQETIKYFYAAKKLSEELHIDEGYDESVIRRGNANINNNDSLTHIATNAYWTACHYLEERNDINILPFIIVGSWLESLYLAINTMENPHINNEITFKISQQRPAIKNLIQYLLDVMMDSNAFEINKDIQNLLNQLYELDAIYDKMQKNDANELSSKQFESIRNIVQTTRKKYIEGV